MNHNELDWFSVPYCLCKQLCVIRKMDSHLCLTFAFNLFLAILLEKIEVSQTRLMSWLEIEIDARLSIKTVMALFPSANFKFSFTEC